MERQQVISKLRLRVAKDEDGRIYRLDNITSPSPRPNLTYEYKGYQPPANGWAVSRERMEEMDRAGRLYLPLDKERRIQRKRYLDELEGETVVMDPKSWTQEWPFLK